MTTSPAADHGTHIGEMFTVDWKIREFARSLTEKRDRAAEHAKTSREKDDLLNEMCARSEASIYGDVLEALHIWTDGQYGVRR